MQGRDETTENPFREISQEESRELFDRTKNPPEVMEVASLLTLVR